MLTEKTFNTGAAVLNYAEGPPSGPPLILLHGFQEKWQSFLPLIPVLSLRWHVYALDLRGHGKSSWVSERYTLDRYLSDLVAFVEHLDQPVGIFGHSLGGLVSLDFPELWNAYAAKRCEA